MDQKGHMIDQKGQKCINKPTNGAFEPKIPAF